MLSCTLTLEGSKRMDEGAPLRASDFIEPPAASNALNDEFDACDAENKPPPQQQAKVGKLKAKLCPLTPMVSR
jgi:hypothetical protein